MENTKVVIIGSGISGLALGALLLKCKIPFILLESNSLESVKKQNRAGVVEARASKMFYKWGYGDLVVGPPLLETEYRFEGESFFQKSSSKDMQTEIKFCSQQLLVANLIGNLQSKNADLRYNSNQVNIENADSNSPTVTYLDNEGNNHTITCEFVAGCDGHHGISKKVIPKGFLTEYSHDFKMSWINLLVDTPPRTVMSMGKKGLVCQFPRHNQSRIYLQCSPDDRLDQWTDERLWKEIKNRLYEPEFEEAVILEKAIFPLRAVVYEPMRYNKIFLLGDAAHLITPVAGKGMNLALYDVDVFASALNDYYSKNDSKALNDYSETCLKRIWNYQEFSFSLVEMLHDATEELNKGTFRYKLAQARLKRLIEQPEAANLYSALMAGI